jgi:hypothetical protein
VKFPCKVDERNGIFDQLTLISGRWQSEISHAFFAHAEVVASDGDWDAYYEYEIPAPDDSMVLTKLNKYTARHLSPTRHDTKGLEDTFSGDLDQQGEVFSR